MQKFRKSGKISRTLFIINTVSLLLSGILSVILSYRWFSKTMYSEIEVELKNVTACLSASLNLMYPGDYTMTDEEPPVLYKGNYNLSEDYTLLDTISAATDFQITVFYQDIRALTTLPDHKGGRFTGTSAPEIVVDSVLKDGETHFYKNVSINGTEYLSLYVPLRNSDGSIAGMLFAGKPRDNVDASVQKAVFPLLLLHFLAAAMIALFNFTYTRRFVASLLKIHVFLAEISKGNLSADLDGSVLERKDELGEIGHSAVQMRRSVSTMIERDELTGLYNRRFAERRLRQLISQAAGNAAPFCIAIGDIDFFKRVNDTYGHESGDRVLKDLSDCMQRHMAGKGFVSRFGGEEFLLVYENMTLGEACADLEQLMTDIRNMECSFGGNIVRVTMTFGLTAGGFRSYTLLLRDADNLLYRGKENGRNRIEY